MKKTDIAQVPDPAPFRTGAGGLRHPGPGETAIAGRVRHPAPGGPERSTARDCPGNEMKPAMDSSAGYGII
jgi:hypothetical protein